VYAVAHGSERRGPNGERLGPDGRQLRACGAVRVSSKRQTGGTAPRRSGTASSGRRR
jgi:hypothetical protein